MAGQGLYDVAVVGAGPAGAAIAAYLARAGWQVALLERAAFPRHKPCAEYLSPAVEPLLHELGVLDEIEAGRPSRLRGFRIYAPNGSAFQADFAGTRMHSGQSIFETGLAVPRYTLDASLAAAAQRAGAQLHERWRLARLAREGTGSQRHHVLVPACDSAPVRARLLVGADGVHSTVARRLNLQMPGRMRKVALVAHMRGIAGLDAYGEMHVFGKRYVGLAPLERPEVGDLCNVALVVDERRDGPALGGRPEAFLLDALQTFPGLRGRLDAVTVVRRTLATSRLCVHARRSSGDALLLVGDAAGYYDPFTGEGIYRALRGAQLAAEVAGSALREGDLSAVALSRYDRLQRATFRGKRTVEAIIQASVQVPPFMNRISHALGRRKNMADTVVAVTGDFLPPSAVLRPGYLLRLLL